MREICLLEPSQAHRWPTSAVKTQPESALTNTFVAWLSPHPRIVYVAPIIRNITSVRVRKAARITYLDPFRNYCKLFRDVILMAPVFWRRRTYATLPAVLMRPGIA